jgi:hypothetical protein
MNSCATQKASPHYLEKKKKKLSPDTVSTNFYFFNNINFKSLLKLSNQLILLDDCKINKNISFNIILILNIKLKTLLWLYIDIKMLQN